MHRLLPALALLAAVDAHAVRPPETTSLGFSTVPVERVRTQRADVQSMLQTQPAWRDFLAGDGADWEATFDEVTRVPVRMWGPGIDLGPLRDQGDVVRAAWSFVDAHRSLLGIDGVDVTMTRVNPFEAGDAWYVDLVPQIDGLPVHEGLVTLRFKAGKLVMAGADTYPEVPVTGTFEVSRRAALRAHVLEGSAPRARHQDLSAEPMLLPLVLGGKPELRRVFATTSRTAEPRGDWHGFVDAETGELLALSNHVRFLSGTLNAEHDGRLGPGTTTTSPVPFAEIRAEDERGSYVDDTYTDADGTFTVDDAEVYTVSLDGDRARVFDEEGDVEPVLDPLNPFVTGDDFGERPAALTTYIYLHQAQDWARALAPEVSWSNQRVRAFVNIDDSCNAFFDGDVNFFQANSDCNNTGRLADVIFHEWGHGFHTFSILSGFYDGSVGEGAADVMSFLMTDDSRVAPRFFKGNGGALRNTDNNQRYPDDYVAGDFAIHSNGLIFGGSMWDTREALRDTVGEPAATEIAGSLYAGILKGGPDMLVTYDEAVFTDDDDGDLSNGTPHQCEIVDGFGQHGLGPGAGRGLRTNHVPIESVPAKTDVTVDLTLPNPAPDCLTLEPSGGTVHYRIEGGEWSEVSTAVVGDDLEGSIPGAELGDLVEYWVEVTDTDGGTYAEPPGGPIRPHTFYVGDVLEVRCSDFEGGDAGYTSELVAGEESEGANDWQLGAPIGFGGDPVGCFSGSACWGNDLGGGNFNGEYQNEKHNRLTSRVYDLGHYEGNFLHYRRWLTVEDGFYDRARILADGEEVWTNWSSSRDNGQDHHVDDAWAAHAVPFTDVDDDRRVQFSWEILSDQGLSFGGWNIDDVCIFAPATPGNRLGISDLSLARAFDGGHPILGWTMPEHAPVTEVVVVRKGGSFPTDPSDGAVIWRTTDPELGAAVSVPDYGAVGKADLYYAVYASDGETWLPWTIEGFNATSLDAEAGGAACGCNGGSGSAPWWLALVGLVGLRRRRD